MSARRRVIPCGIPRVRRRHGRGFSLVELMIVLVIASVLVAIGYPAYQQYVRRANRNDAYAALLAMASAQEKAYLANSSYTTSLTALQRTAAADTKFYTDKGLYELTVPVANTNAFTLRASAVAGRGQANDAGCTQIQITQDNAKTPADCW